jgi:Zn-dependent peptidase ImmA (M78 family)
LSFHSACAKINLSPDILQSYIEAKREINFSEISVICHSIGLNPVRLLFSKDYSISSLAFRNVSYDIQLLASKIEDVFLLIRDSLPEIENIPVLNRSLTTGYRREDVIHEAAGFASKFRSRYKTPENFISNHQIPIIPIQSNEKSFDAFLICHGNKSAICINSNKPPQRIIFSLLHEICHLLFDRGKQLSVDVFLPNLHWDSQVTKEQLPEFFAYKFAQFYLVPQELIIKYCKNFPELQIDKLQKIVNYFRTSKEVLCNSIFDTISSNPTLFKHKDAYNYDRDEYIPSGDQFRRMDYEEGRDSIQPEEIYTPQDYSFLNYKNLYQAVSIISPSSTAKNIFSFLDRCKKDLCLNISKNLDIYSDEILHFIESVVQIELR